MRDYKQVNIERYEKDKFDGRAIENNIYAAINPTGNYGVYKITQLLRKYISLIRQKNGKSYDEISFLDCGCGTGLWTRIIANLLESPDNVYGFEYSENRLAQCKRMNSAIHYTWGNLVGGVPEEFGNIQFDGIMAVDVLSQIRKKEDILKAINNIKNSLEPQGLFLWYEINSKTHETNYNLDSQGFSESEMDEYATQCGMHLVYKSRMYGAIKYRNHIYSTYYNVNDSWRGIKFMEFVDPLLLKIGHLNNIRCYGKLNET